MLRLFRALMDRTINFNDQSRFMAIKIGNIPSDGMLPSEFKFRNLMITQPLPEFFFAGSHFLP